LQPAARNPKAIKAYQKIGFIIQKNRPNEMKADYVDAVFIIKRIGK